MLNKIQKNNYPYEEKQLPYPELRGMDLYGGGGFAYLENMYIDYDGGGDAVESIVGFRKIRAMKAGIHSLCQIGRENCRVLIIHSGDRLYLGRVNERDKGLPLKEIGRLRDGESTVLAATDRAVLTDGERLISVTDEGKVTLLSEDKKIAGCRCGTIYGERLFLSGNPDFRGEVFYSSPISQDDISFFRGFSEGDTEVISLISLDGRLWVFKKDMGGSSAVCHTEEKEGDSLSFPVTMLIDPLDICSNVGMFGREIIFMSSGGLMAIDFSTGKEARLICRSAKINRLLLREELSNAKFAVWMGYLVISFGERVYLADPRDIGGYGWYLLNGIGGYRDEKRLFRYSDKAEEGLLLHPKANAMAEGEIFSIGREAGEMIYYSKEADECYSVYPTAELYGGEFGPHFNLISDGKLMWFVTEAGGLYLFNNDKRGCYPSDVQFADLDGENMYRPSDTAIHPLYYSFAGHAPSYIALIHPQDRKRTEREGDGLHKRCKIDLKAISDKGVTVLVMNNEKELSSHKIAPTKQSKANGNANEAPTRHRDFVIVRLPEPRRGVSGEQLCITADEFASPFGIRSVKCLTHTKK